MQTTAHHQPQSLRLSTDEDNGALVMEGVLPGPAGIVDLVLDEETSVIFDATTAQVVTLTVGDSPDARSMLARLIGEQEANRLMSEHPVEGEVTFEPSPYLQHLYRLSLLGLAQSNDPLFPASPLWGAEEVALASACGLGRRARDVALQVYLPLLDLLEGFALLGSHEGVVRIALSVAEAVDEDDPGMARQIQEFCEGAKRDAASFSRDLRDLLASEGAGVLMGGEALDLSYSPGVLWLSSLPRDTFKVAEDPSRDLSLIDRGDQIVVSVGLDQRAHPLVVHSCLVRILDQEDQVRGVAPLMVDETQDPLEGREQGIVSFERSLFPKGGFTLELVSDPEVPVRSVTDRKRTLALRYGAAALRSWRQPGALHPQWAPEAFTQDAKGYWLSSSAVWHEIGDEDRGNLARHYAGREIQGELPAWGLELLHPASQTPFVAEVVGELREEYPVQ